MMLDGGAIAATGMSASPTPAARPLHTLHMEPLPSHWGSLNDSA